MNDAQKQPPIMPVTSPTPLAFSWGCSMRLSACLLLLMSPLLLAEPRAITVDDLWAVERVGPPVASPDGRTLAFTVSVFNTEKNAANVDLWTVAADGSSDPIQLTRQAGADGSPVFSPDSSKLAFVSARDEQPPQLYLLPLAGGEAQALTDWPLGIKRAAWLPDGKRLVVEALTWPDLNADAAKVKARSEAVKVDLTQAKISESRALRYWDRYLTDGTRAHLFLLNLDDRSLTDLMPGFERWVGFEGFEWDLNTQGTAIVYSANSTAPPHQNLNYDIWWLDIASGKTDNLTASRPGFDGRPVFAPNGLDVVFSGTRRENVPSDIGRLFRYNRGDRTTTELLAQFDYPVSAWRFSADGKALYFHAEQAGKVNLYVLPSGAAGPTKLVAGGTTDGAAPLGAGRVAYTIQDFSTPPEIYAYAQGTSKQLSRFNQKRMAELKLGEVRDLSFPGANDSPVQMFVAYPPGFSERRKYPLLMLAHGGPFSAWLDSFNFRWNAQVFAAKGYVVALPNWHGSTGFGQPFADALLGAHGDKSSVDTLKATDWLIAQGYIDAQRMAIAGGSYGGYLTALVVGQTDRFKAAINHAGVFDLSGQFASDSAWDRPTSYGAAPWTDPLELDRWSPSRLVPNMKTPTLILHGELDYRVPVTQGINMYGALTGKGVPARIVLFPNENHWILKPQASRLWYGEFFAWLDRYL